MQSSSKLLVSGKIKTSEENTEDALLLHLLLDKDGIVASLKSTYSVSVPYFQSIPKVGDSIFEILSKEQLSDFQFYLKKAAAKQKIEVVSPVSEKYFHLIFDFVEEKGKVFLTASFYDEELYKKGKEYDALQNEFKFTSIFKQASQGIVMFNLEQNKLIVNDKFNEFLGYTNEEMEALSVQDLIHPDDFEESIGRLDEIKNNVTDHYVLEGRMVHKDGQSIWVQMDVTSIKSKKSEPRYAIAVVHDISSRKIIENAHRESEIKFRSIFEHAAVGMMQVDLNLKWLSINDKFCQIVGYTGDELKYLNTKAITYPEDYLIDLISIDKLRRGVQKSYTREKRYIHKDGHIVWVSVSVSLLRDSDDKPKYFISIIQDISSRKKAEQELIYKNNELDTFLYRASHDLKGPISSLIGLSNVAELEVTDQDALKYFYLVKDRALKMDSILNTLAELGKIKDTDIEVKQINPEAVVQDCLRALKEIPANVEISIQNKSKNLVHSDESILFIVVYNILENAMRYHSNKNVPFVRVNISDIGPASIKISVTDNGIGVSDEIEEKIFNMFYKGTERSKGSGLGLYIAKNSIEKLKGTIELNNTMPKETTFNIYLPTLKK